MRLYGIILTLFFWLSPQALSFNCGAFGRVLHDKHARLKIDVSPGSLNQRKLKIYQETSPKELFPKVDEFDPKQSIQSRDSKKELENFETMPEEQVNNFTKLFEDYLRIKSSGFGFDRKQVLKFLKDWKASKKERISFS